jgi:hypothetical protein
MRYVPIPDEFTATVVLFDSNVNQHFDLDVNLKASPPLVTLKRTY